MSLSSTTINTLALLADAYTPALLLMALLLVARSWKNGKRWHLAQFIYAVLVVYALMFADKYFQWWASLGLDYSTHSAAAFALVVVISINQRGSLRAAFAVSLVFYGCLMYLLGYHTWVDMLTTIVAVGAVLFPFLRFVPSAKASLSGY